MWTKKQLIDKALEKIGAAAYLFDVTPDEYASALLDLDAMMAMWDASNVRVGYLLPSNPDESTPDQESGLPDWANLPVALCLGPIIAPGFGKTVSIEAKVAAERAYRIIAARVSYPPQMALRYGTPIGAGNKWKNGWLRPFVENETSQDVTVDNVGPLNNL